MKQKFELKEMNIDELVEFAYEMQNTAMTAEYLRRENQRLMNMLTAIGVVMEAYNSTKP